ncbi:hypothetical protein [Flagellimonas beolgyonensis]|uniref:hypothetical protein n=1 Tax=Flagellimonas beolgyonensis TaxID=864064 RepID=UPI003D657BB6
MKQYGKALSVTLALVMGFMAADVVAQQQEKVPLSKISYSVPFGPVFPIEGESGQIRGKLALDDETGAIEKVSFDVPLNTFFGQNSDYLNWLGNGWRNPDLSFHGSSVSPNGENGLIVNGTLEFRRSLSPVSIQFTKKIVGEYMVLTGTFNLRTGDYFIGPLNRRVVPTQIPFEITLVLDHVEPPIKGSMVLHPRDPDQVTIVGS